MVSTGFLKSQTYCTPSFPNGCAAIDDFIISAAGTSPGFSHIATYCSPNGYTNYSTMSISLQAGLAHPYVVKHLFSSTWNSAT